MITSFQEIMFKFTEKYLNTKAHQRQYFLKITRCIYQVNKTHTTMMKNFKLQDILILAAAFLSLVYSEISWFKGEHETGLFVGLWVPSIIGLGIYIKLLKKK